MPNLQNSGTISLDDLKAFFGGLAAPKLSDYYRGGSYVLATANVTTQTRQPTTGEWNVSGYYWYRTNGVDSIYWGGVGVYYGNSGNASTIVVGNTTYYRGNMYSDTTDQYNNTTQIYGIYRIAITTTSQNVNQNVPTSGVIRLSNFYGAYKP